MRDLLLPPKVRQEITKEKWVTQRREWAARVDAVMDYDDPVCKDWAGPLSELDPFLKLGKARERADVEGTPIRAGFYHFVRCDPSAPMTVLPITGPDDGFTVPDSRELEALKRRDLQNPQVVRDHLAARAQAEAQREWELEQSRQEVRDEVVDRVKAAFDARVSMADGWSQNAAGKRGRKEKKS